MATLSLLLSMHCDKAYMLDIIVTALYLYVKLLIIYPQDLTALNIDVLYFQYALQSLGVVQVFKSLLLMAERVILVRLCNPDRNV